MGITSWIRGKKQKDAAEVEQIRTELSGINGTSRINLARAVKKLGELIRKTKNNPTARQHLIDAMNFISNLATNLDRQPGIEGKKPFSTVTKNLYDNAIRELGYAETELKK